jgi:hypothetical protein
LHLCTTPTTSADCAHPTAVAANVDAGTLSCVTFDRLEEACATYRASGVPPACHQGCTVPFSERGKWQVSIDQRDPALSHPAPNNIGLVHLAAQAMTQNKYVHVAARLRCALPAAPQCAPRALGR